MSEALRPLGGHSIFVLLVQLSMLLLVARLGAELCRRMALPAVLGELAAGIALGPTGLGHFAPRVFLALFPPVAEQFHLLEVVGMLGMVLLLLLTGLETDLRLLKNLGRAALIASAMGMVVPFVSGFGLGMLLPTGYLAQPDRRVLFSFFLATAMAISAMPVIAKILMDLDLAKRNIGLVILSAGVVDDTAGWLILSVIAGAASHGHVRLAEFGRTLALTGGFLAAAAFLVYPLARASSRLFARRFKSPDADLVGMLIFTFLLAAATEWVGIHAVFGAFVAGIIFRQVPSLRPEMVQRLESFVFSVLAPVFFGIVGLRVDLWAIGGGGMLLVVLLVACLGKLVGSTVGSLWGGLRFWEGLSIAVAMNARGAMELVVATIGLSLGILNQQMFSMIVMVAVVTSFMAPLGLRLTMRKVRMTEEEEKRILAAQSKGVFDPGRVRVLVPTAGGRNELGAASLAAGIAKRSDYPVEMMRVKAPESWRTRLLRFLGPRQERAANGHAANGKSLADLGLTGEVRELKRPSAALAILDEARNGFDVVVMGASRHGQGLGGETLEEVVRAAPCHLVIVKAGPAEPPYQSLLVCYDGGVFSRVAVEFAARYAELTGSQLAVAVISDRSAQPARADDVTEMHPVGANELQASNGTLNRISPVFNTLELRPRLVDIPNDPFSTALVTEARSGKYDMVVLGSENRAVQNRLFFGRDNERLIREAAVTVAIVVPNVALLR
jgi:Kef-type K+ transport system membrane component KefB/nucleotide-binding universal stress UspA family protein